MFNKRTYTEFVHATTEDLLKKTSAGTLDINNLMKYVYFMLPLGSTIQDAVNKAIEKGITQDFSSTNEILNYYGYRNGNYQLGIDLKEITRIQDVNELNVSLNTKAYQNKNYLNNVQLDVSFLNGAFYAIKMALNGFMVDPEITTNPQHPQYAAVRQYTYNSYTDGKSHTGGHIHAGRDGYVAIGCSGQCRYHRQPRRKTN